MTVTNPGSSASTAISVLLYELDAGPLPFGAPSCSQCSATAGQPFVGLEWSALAPGETRQLAFALPVTAPAGHTVWFASLYGQPLTDVEHAAASGGIQPAQEDWKVATTVTPG